MIQNRFEVFSTKVAQVVKSIQCIKSQKMAQYGLKGTTCFCLCQILEGDRGLTARELAERGAIDKAQVSRCVAELTKSGLIYLARENGRRYKQRYCLTERGYAVAADIAKSTLEVQRQAESGIAEEELATFYQVLDRLCDNFTAITAEKR